MAKLTKIWLLEWNPLITTLLNFPTFHLAEKMPVENLFLLNLTQSWNKREILVFLYTVSISLRYVQNWTNLSPSTEEGSCPGLEIAVEVFFLIPLVAFYYFYGWYRYLWRKCCLPSGVLINLFFSFWIWNTWMIMNDDQLLLQIGCGDRDENRLGQAFSEIVNIWSKRISPDQSYS